MVVPLFGPVLPDEEGVNWVAHGLVPLLPAGLPVLLSPPLWVGVPVLDAHLDIEQVSTEPEKDDEEDCSD